MSTSGTKLTQQTKNKISLVKRKFSEPALIKETQHYFESLKKDQLPTLSGLAIYLKITPATLKNYALTYSNFNELLEVLINAQEENLIQKALNNKINVGFAQFLLKAKHNYIDSPQNLTQNNYTNISPEVLKEALSLMSKKE